MGLTGPPVNTEQKDEPDVPSLTHRTVGNMVWTAWGGGATALLKIVVLVILTRLLSPADFGVVGAALVVVTLCLNFSQIGLGPALVQRPVLEPRHISTAFLTSVVSGFLVGGITWMAAPAIAQFFRMEQLAPVVRWLALVFPIAGIATVPESLLQRELRFRFLANRDVIAYGVGYGVTGVTLALLGWGVYALVAAQLTQASIQAILLVRTAPRLLAAAPTGTSLLELVSYGAGHSAARFGVVLASQADNLVVGRWLGAVALGLYSRAYQLMSVPTGLLGDVFDKVLFPTMARVQHDQVRLASAYLQGTAFLALVTLPAGVMAAVLAPEIVETVFGARWLPMVPAFQVLALGMLFRTGFRMSDSLSRATGRVYRRAWRQILFAGLVFLSAWIGHFWGITGVAVGVLAALCCNYLLMAQLALSVGQISWGRFVEAQRPALQISLLVGAVALGIAAAGRHFGIHHTATLGAGLLASGAIFLLAASLAPTLALGEHGLRVRDTLRNHIQTRMRGGNHRGKA